MRGRSLSRGRGQMRGSGRSGSYSRDNRFNDRMERVRAKRAQLNLLGGNKRSCDACFGMNHSPSQSFSNCKKSCIFCNVPLSNVRHAHLECRRMPWDYDVARGMILTKMPFLNSAKL